MNRRSAPETPLDRRIVSWFHKYKQSFESFFEEHRRSIECFFEEHTDSRFRVGFEMYIEGLVQLFHNIDNNNTFTLEQSVLTSLTFSRDIPHETLNLFYMARENCTYTYVTKSSTFFDKITSLEIIILCNWIVTHNLKTRLGSLQHRLNVFAESDLVLKCLKRKDMAKVNRLLFFNERIKFMISFENISSINFPVFRI